MANLMDGISKIPEKEAAKQIAEMQTYRVSVYLGTVGKRIFRSIAWCIQKILLLMKKEMKLLSAETIDERYQRKTDEIIQQDIQDIQKQLRKTILSKLRWCRRFQTFLAKSDDRHSAIMTQFVVKLFDGKKLRGFSIPEKNDYIFQQYPHRKEINYRRRLRAWFACAFLVMLLFLGGIWFSSIPAKILVVCLCVVEVGGAFLFSRKLAQWQLAHYVWLSSSALGGSFAVDRDAMPSNCCSEELRNSYVVELRAYHTLCFMTSRMEENCRQILELQKKGQECIKGNELRITKLQEKLQKDDASKEETLRMIRDKQKENQTLAEDCKKQEGKYAELQKQLVSLKKILQQRENLEMNKIKKRWEEAFPEYLFADDFLTQVIRLFEYGDFERIEQRIFEMRKTSDPFALAERKNSDYIVEFRTLQTGIGTLGFKSKKGKILFCKAERERTLEETPISGDELKKIINAENDNSFAKYEKAIKELIERLRQKEEEVRIFQIKVRGLEQEVEEKNQEMTELSSKMEKKEQECRRLKEELDRLENEAGEDSEAYKNLYAKYMQCHEDLMKCINTCTEREDELKEKDKELQEAQEKYSLLEQKLEQEWKNQKSEIARIKKEYQEKVIALENQITDLKNQFRMDETLIIRLKKEISKNKQENGKLLDALSKLEDSKRTLESNISKLKEERDINKTEAEQWMVEYSKAEENNKRTKEELNHLRIELENARKEISRLNARGIQGRTKALETRWALFFEFLLFEPGVFKNVMKEFSRGIFVLEEKLMKLNRAEDPMTLNDRGTMHSGEAHCRVFVDGVASAIFYKALSERKEKANIIKIEKHSDYKYEK